MKTAKGKLVPQGGDSDHVEIYTWQRLVTSDEYRQKTAFTLAASQNPHQFKTRDTIVAGHGP